ncbi:hypothetical protein [Aquimarina algiphila]|uniref:Uncharacterized protein n=1 Tax=Aquimarina algiphila TaxID=2047982 RepID=A0A554VDK7_9FLAO|nr:hypothetical protein [Aquimarina algiphila]TSE04978.1 hypothetical protein FOF46_24440 [Aquimarina algiphila]
MKNKFLIVALLLISYRLLAQELDTPSIVYNDTDLSWQNFPAISEDGSYYLIIYNEYSCCVDTGSILQQRSVTTGEINKEIILYPNETDQIEFSSEKKATIIKEVQDLLKETSYFKLFEVKKHQQIQQKDNNELFVKAKLLTQSFTSKSVNLPLSKLHGFCCTGDYDSKESCDVSQSIENVWLSKKHQLLLIESGVTHPADGCDDGPYYTVTPLLKE